MLRMHALLISTIFVATAQAQTGTGGPFAFFGGADIDYWREGKRVHDGLTLVATPESTATPASGKNEKSSFSGSTLVREADAKAFSWDAYRNPQAPEFWDDGGDWIPPRPFREAAANPTAKNIDEYLEWQVRKTHVVNRFQAALTREGNKLSPGRKEKDLGAPKVVNWQKLRIAYFYQSSCPHCRASAPVIEEAQRRGARVTFVQLDAREQPPLHAGSVAYDASWAKEFAISSTPTWILKSGQKTESVTGALTLTELADKASHLSQPGKDK